MDPNAALTALLRAAIAIADRSEGQAPADVTDVDAMADAALALDEWITRGGFLPTPWARTS